ncbi:MAG TPA: hypothetical protein VHN16_01965 [Streptosporangiaceae bacterium]|nr:hypothetical protein [Streptosporangiaceae bacterium]
MHFNLTRTVGVMAIPLLGSALAVGATALPAHATTYSDTGLFAGLVTADTFGGAGLTAADGTATDITLSGTGVAAWSIQDAPPGITVSGTTISNSVTGTGTGTIVVDATDSAGNAEALQIPVTLADSSIQTNGLVVTDSLSALAEATTAGTVTFSATSSASNTISYAESSLPTGLVSGNPTLTYVGGTAAPGTYSNVKVTATDSDGAVLNGTFTLTVDTGGVYTLGTAGDEVNPFGNGFDVYQQRQAPGTVIAGWPATQPDPATHFLILAGTHAGAVKFQYAPNGKGTGLCVSDPRGGWASDPLPDGLILAWCNTGRFQQFVPQSDGTLKNVATGLYVNPAGKGAQLRGGATPTTWGGSVYIWTEYSSLPV